MKNLLHKQLIVCTCLLITIASCKKNTIQDYQNVPKSNAAPIPDSRKALLVNDKAYNANTNKYFSNLYYVSDITTTPKKNLIFTTIENTIIRDVTLGKGVNNVYFIGHTYNDPQDQLGIWNVTVDGSKKNHLIKEFAEGRPYELDVDRVNGKLYWGEGLSNIFTSIWRSNLDGTGKEKITIKGLNFGLNKDAIQGVNNFVVDGLKKRIFFHYTYIGGFKHFIGCCDFNGNIITPVVTSFDDPSYGYVFDIKLDFTNQKLYAWTSINQVGSFKVASMNGNNVVPQTILVNNNLSAFQACGFDFLSSMAYYTQMNNRTTISTSDFQGNNKNIFMNGFFDVSGIDVISTY
jgi:hypothetical protein